MPFFVYILRCSDGSYHTGETDELAKRLAAHQRGETGGYTAGRRPLTLVFSEDFPRREEARERQRQIKGWSRRKKEALIRGDWEALVRHAAARE